MLCVCVFMCVFMCVYACLLHSALWLDGLVPMGRVFGAVWGAERAVVLSQSQQPQYPWQREAVPRNLPEGTAVRAPYHKIWKENGINWSFFWSLFYLV